MMGLLHLGWHRWAWGCFVLFAVSLGGCERPSSPNHTKKTLEPVLAWVGKNPITEKEFLSRYLQSKSKAKPEDFLQGLIEEEILWKKAQAMGLLSARQIREETQKAMMLQLLKVGFEKMYNPRSIPVGLVLEVYNARRAEFLKPVRLRTCHVLVSPPKHPSHQRLRRGKTPPPISASDQAQLDAEWSRRQRILGEILVALKAAKVRTQKEFKKVVSGFAARYNRPDPSVQQVGQAILSALQLDPKMTTASMNSLFQELLVRLSKSPVCSMCLGTRQFLRGWQKSLKKQDKIIPKAERKRLQILMYRLLQQKEETLRLEDIPAFPEEMTVGFTNVVRPFAKAAYALKDGQFSPASVKTKFGLHLIFRIESLPPEKRTFSEVEESIRKEIYELQKKQMFRRWLDGLLANHRAKIFTARLKKLQTPPAKGR